MAIYLDGGIKLVQDVVHMLIMGLCNSVAINLNGAEALCVNNSRTCDSSYSCLGRQIC